MRGIRVAFPAAVFVILVASAAHAQVQLIDKVIAIVNDTVLTQYDVDKALAPYMPRLAKIPNEKAREEMLQRARKNFLDNLVNRELVLQRARELNLTVDDSEVDTFLEQMKKRNRWSDQQLAMAMKQFGFTIAEYKEHLRRELLMTRVQQLKVVSRIKISSKMVSEIMEQDYYKGKFEDHLRVSHILFEIQPWFDAEKIAKVRKEAERIYKRALEGKVKFAKLAEDWSDDDESADKGGDLGWITRGQTDPALDDVLFKMAVDTVRGPVRSRFGFHIVKVTAKKQIPIKDVAKTRAKIRMVLRQKALKKNLAEWLRELRVRAYIKTNDYE